MWVSLAEKITPLVKLTDRDKLKDRNPNSFVLLNTGQREDESIISSLKSYLSLLVWIMCPINY